MHNHKIDAEGTRNRWPEAEIGGHTGRPVRKRGLDLVADYGAGVCVEKPFDLQEVLDLVAWLLRSG